MQIFTRRIFKTDFNDDSVIRFYSVFYLLVNDLKTDVNLVKAVSKQINIFYRLLYV